MADLTRAKPKATRFNFITMDIETDKQNGSALLGDCIYITWSNGKRDYGVKCQNLTGWMLHHFLVPERDGWIIYVHNGFGFDYKRMDFDVFASLGFEASFLRGRDGNIKGIKIYRGDFVWHIRDSLLLIPATLAKVTATFAPGREKIKREKSFDESPFNPDDYSDRMYALQDAGGLYEALKNMDSILREHFELSLHDAPTLPGIAFRAFRLGMEKGEKYPGVGFAAAHAARESYHGGQTIAFNTSLADDVVSIDANSMYPYVMINWELPTGKPRHYLGANETAHPDRTLCLAVVYIPAGVFPVLKTKDRYGRVGNYAGVVSGWYWKFELDFQKSIGASYEILECWEWPETTDVAKRFSEKCRDLRMSDTKIFDDGTMEGGPLADTAKRINNSGYGKFAQQSVSHSLIMSREQPTDEAIPFYIPELQEMKSALWLIENPPAYYKPDMVHWASFITAKSRVVLTDAIRQIGFRNVLYCDTDSIFTRRDCIGSIPHLLGHEYGQFKIEKGTKDKGILFRAIAPKAYKYQDDEGKVFVRNKGIPKKALESQDGFSRLGEENQAIEFIQSHNLSQMLKRQTGYGRNAKRKVATRLSTTNGKIVNDIWQPVACELRELKYIRGVETGSYLSKIYDTIIDRFNYEETEGKQNV